ncbi:MAG TPA: 2-oxo acid dehydrogenase subunit E2 [Verrucomicrobiae bacterium]|jgi:pyruvate dehydrogenase E2 component (dihydrolipoamide acetyltransferase)|nr:2-oxo acid dehydrogenase subunit E2 [Verrucomicrobiae bacterium]
MDVKLPKLGEGAESGVVVSIAVKEGDQINKGQTVLELENEKAVAAIPSSASGTVKKINVKPGDRISVGQVLIILDGAGAPSAEAPAPKSAQPKATGKPARAAAAETEPEPDEEEQTDEEPQTAADKAGFPPPASPSIRKLARDIGLDLRLIRGSESGGRIVLDDIRAYIKKLQRQAARPTAAGGAPAPEAKPPAEQIDFSQWGTINKKPFSPLRQTIARRMVENSASIPHVTQFDEADITALTELRKKFAPEYEKKGARLTLTSFALKAVANTLKKFPIFNSSLDEVANELVFKEYFHIGLAVDTEQGLLVPVIRDVDRKDLLQLSKDVQELAEKARTRKVSLEEMKGGTFTISNQGGIGGGHFTPIINKPNVAILGLGRAAMKPVFTQDKKIEPRLMMPLALSYDHRVIDGGEAARFTVELVQAFETFKEADVKK